MGREVRRVPKDWQHPKDENGHYRPLYEGYAGAKLDFEKTQAEKGLQAAIEDWGSVPDQNDYMPDWPESEKTHWQMYESVTEGTPISPVMESPGALAHWLADNQGDAGAGRTASYEQWLSTIRRGFAPSMGVVDGRGLISGVEAFHEPAK